LKSEVEEGSDPDPNARRDAIPRIQTPADLLWSGGATSFQPGREGEIAMAKGQMRSNKEKKKPKADKNIKKGGAAPSPFASAKPPGQNPYGKKG
jgi:hypothetical protein